MTQEELERLSEHWRNYAKEVEEEVAKLSKDLGRWAFTKKGTSAETTLHNSRYKTYEKIFQDTLLDINSGSPALHAKIALQVVELYRLKEEGGFN